MRPFRAPLVLLLFAPPAPAASIRDPGLRPDAPQANTGFQGHIATGLTFPAGRASGASGDALGARYAWQWPFELGLGAKPSEHVYVGGYFVFGLGAEGSDSRVARACVDKDNDLNNDVSCSAYSLHAGIEARWTFSPDRRTTPWLSYGAGPTLASQNIDDRPSARSETTTVTGWDFARVGLGLDLRAARAVGLGPYVGVAFGRYLHTKTEVNGVTTYDGAIDQAAWHSWISVGARIVLFP
jgi:hypothetical protein